MAYNFNQKVLLAQYRKSLEIILKGEETDSLYGTSGTLLLESVANFPEKYRQEIKAALKAGIEQDKYLIAKTIVDSLKKGKEKRLETIQSFLKKYQR